MNKAIQYPVRLLLKIAVVTALVIGCNILINGMWILGLPDLRDIQSASIAYPSLTDEIKEASNSDDVELALKLTGFLKYDLFAHADNNEEPLVTITYHLKNGNDQIISANHNTVWWNGKAYSMKEKDIFINLTEGIFFMNDIIDRPTTGDSV